MAVTVSVIGFGCVVAVCCGRFLRIQCCGRLLRIQCFISFFFAVILCVFVFLAIWFIWCILFAGLLNRVMLCSVNMVKAL